MERIVLKEHKEGLRLIRVCARCSARMLENRCAVMELALMLERNPNESLLRAPLPEQAPAGLENGLENGESRRFRTPMRCTRSYSRTPIATTSSITSPSRARRSSGCYDSLRTDFRIGPITKEQEPPVRRKRHRGSRLFTGETGRAS